MIARPPTAWLLAALLLACERTSAGGAEGESEAESEAGGAESEPGEGEGEGIGRAQLVGEGTWGGEAFAFTCDDADPVWAEAGGYVDVLCTDRKRGSDFTGPVIQVGVIVDGLAAGSYLFAAGGSPVAPVGRSKVYVNGPDWASNASDSPNLVGATLVVAERSAARLTGGFHGEWSDAAGSRAAGELELAFDVTPPPATP